MKLLSFSKFSLLCCVITLFSSATFSSALTDAAKSDDTALALQLINTNADVNEAEADGTTALMWAIHYDNHELSKALIEANTDLDAVNNYGTSVILEAMLAANNETLLLLLEHGINSNWKNAEGETALMIAARSGNLEAAKLLMSHGADVNAKEQWGGQSALMWAITQNQPEMVEYLIDEGADINTAGRAHLWNRRITSETRPKDMNKGGFPPLLYAAREGCLACAHSLVAAGADLDTTDPDRVTALSLALLNQHFDLAAFLVESGADVDKWDIFGRSPLYMAIDMHTLPSTGNRDIPTTDLHSGLDVARMLLERGANPNPQLKMRPPYRQAVADRRADHILSYGATPLMRAAKSSDNESLQLLLKHGARVDIPNWMGVSPIMVAAGLGRTENPTRGAFVNQEQSISTLRILLQAGAKINTQTRAYKGQWATLEDDRPFFNDYPWDGQTALHGAAKLGWTEVVEFLVDEGATMQVSDINNRTALD
jgi:uncharacterized protein